MIGDGEELVAQEKESTVQVLLDQSYEELAEIAARLREQNREMELTIEQMYEQLTELNRRARRK